MNIFKALAMFITLSVVSFGQTDWNIDKSHSNVQFTVTHMVISEVTGSFNIFEGKLTQKNGKDFTGSSIDFTADAASIFTDNDKRDQHLRSDDFFNSEKYPKMSFKSKSFTKVNDKKYKLVGDLTIRDVTKEVTLDVDFMGTVKDNWGNNRAAFKLSGSIDRFDYGLKWNSLLEVGGAVVGKDVKINCNIQLVTKAG